MLLTAMIEQARGTSWKRTIESGLTIVLLSAVAVAGFALLGSEVLGDFRASEIADPSLASSGTLEGLLSFEAPARTVAKWSIQMREAQQHQIQANFALVLENWKDTSLYTTIVANIKSYIEKFAFPKFQTYTPSNFGPIVPSAFVPAPFGGNIHSKADVTAYNVQQLNALQNDRFGDVSQTQNYQLDEKLSIALVTTLNYKVAAAHLAGINVPGFALVAKLFPIPFVGPVLAGLAAGLIIAADLNIAALLLNNGLANVASFNQAIGQAYALLNQHLAGDTFNPLTPASPYQ